MRQVILIVVLLAAVVFWASQKYSIVTGSSKDGASKAVLVNKSTGDIKILWGN